MKKPNAIAVEVQDIGDPGRDDWVVATTWEAIIRDEAGKVRSRSSSGSWHRIPFPKAVQRLADKAEDEMLTRNEALALAKQIAKAAKDAGFDVYATAER